MSRYLLLRYRIYPTHAQAKEYFYRYREWAEGRMPLTFTISTLSARYPNLEVRWIPRDSMHSLMKGTMPSRIDIVNFYPTVEEMEFFKNILHPETTVENPIRIENE
jgi:hypothetical protein